MHCIELSQEEPEQHDASGTALVPHSGRTQGVTPSTLAWALLVPHSMAHGVDPSAVSAGGRRTGNWRQPGVLGGTQMAGVLGSAVASLVSAPCGETLSVDDRISGGSFPQLGGRH